MRNCILNNAAVTKNHSVSRHFTASISAIEDRKENLVNIKFLILKNKTHLYISTIMSVLKSFLAS